MNTTKRYPPEVLERAVRLVLENKKVTEVLFFVQPPSPIIQLTLFLLCPLSGIKLPPGAGVGSDENLNLVFIRLPLHTSRDHKNNLSQ